MGEQLQRCPFYELILPLRIMCKTLFIKNLRRIFIMNKVEIYYFSGTGNSLHVAKELQKRIPETNLIPMVSLINKDVVETNGETRHSDTIRYR